MGMEQRGLGAERYARSKQFDYHANSNLVLTAERSNRSLGSSFSTPESLWGRINSNMGERAHVTKPSEIIDKKNRKIFNLHTKTTADLKLINEKEIHGISNLNALKKENIRYRPSTKETSMAYEELLGIITLILDGQPNDVIHGAADEIISIIKNESIKNNDKQNKIEALLGKVTKETFADFLSIAKIMFDFIPTLNEDESINKCFYDENVSVAIE